MQRAWLPLALILAVCAGVLFWPAADPAEENQEVSAAEAEEEEARSLAEVGSLPELDEAPTGPLELAPDPEEAAPVREGGEALPSLGETTEDGATVKVRVVNEDGVPLPGATVGVMAVPSINGEQDLRRLQPILFAVQGAPIEVEGAPVNETLSGADGVAELPAPTGVQVVAYARLARHLISFKLAENLALDEERDLGDLRLAPGGYLEVRVLDEFGVAIEDAAVVMVLTNGGNFAEELPIQFLETNEAGQVVFEHLSFKDYKLDVAKHGFQHYHQDPVSITERGDGLIEVALSRGAAMAGTVVDSFGAPVEGVKVTARAREREHRLEGLTEGLLGPAPPVVTDASGGFRMEGLFAEAEYNLEAEPERGISARERERPAEQLRIVLPETAYISGRVISAEGEPVPDGRIYFHPDPGESGRWPRPRVETTGPDGRFEVELSPGLYSYSISHALGQCYSVGSLDMRGELNLGDVQLEPGGRVEFTFLTAQGDATDAVRFRSLNRADGVAGSEPRTIQWSRRPINDGAANPMIFEGLTPGTYALRVSTSAGLAPITTFEVRAGRTDKIDVQLGFGSTLVLDLKGEDGGDINSRFRLERQGPLPPQWGHLTSTHRMRVRSDREFRLGAIVPGRYILREDRRGSEPFAELDLGPGESRHALTVPKRSN